MLPPLRHHAAPPPATLLLLLRSLRRRRRNFVRGGLILGSGRRRGSIVHTACEREQRDGRGEGRRLLEGGSGLGGAGCLRDGGRVSGGCRLVGGFVEGGSWDGGESGGRGGRLLGRGRGSFLRGRRS